MSARLFAIQELLNRDEERRLSPLACQSHRAARRRPEERRGHRQAFAQDADRILHSRAYTRYIDKTQVFSMVDNDHVTHRVLHVQLVSRISRTIGRFLGLNEDLIEAVALGHDIGHPPFGHEGERILSELCRAHGLPSFQHNIQGVQFLDRFEKNGQGLNLSLQVLDGIFCHDGEVHSPELRPDRVRDFAALDALIVAKANEPTLQVRPMTLEGCVVRLADVIAYIGRDLEDAIELELIDRAELPAGISQGLGASNGTIVYTLVTDLLEHSAGVRRGEGDTVAFSPEMAALLLELKKFNYERIYHNPRFKADHARIRACYALLFDHYLKRLRNSGGMEDRNFLTSMSSGYMAEHPPAAVVRDYVAGMTDAFFLRRAAAVEQGEKA